MQPPTSVDELPDKPEIYRPVLLARKGEIIAWLLSLVVGIAWMILLLRGLKVFIALPLLAIFLLVSALSISLGNWMDRQTELQITGDGVEYKNGLRHVRLSWDEIEQVRVISSQWGKKVHVIGPETFFSFRTLGEVKVQGEVKGQMGFLQGEKVLKQILDRSALKMVRQSGQDYYYGRV